MRNIKPIDGQRMNQILESHLINPVPIRADDFDIFMRMRATTLLDLIESATGKRVAGRDSEDTVAAFGAPLINEPQSPTV
jgi:hypothetical protein